MPRLIVGATVVTMDPERRVLPDGAIAIEGDRIAAVGERGALEAAYPTAERLDATGMVAFPGFVNIHTHTMLTVLRGRAEDLGADSLYGQMYPLRSLLGPSERGALGLLGLVESVRFGSTTTLENFVGLADLAPAAERLGARVVLSETVNDAVLPRIRTGAYSFSAEQGERQLAAALALADRWHGRADGRIQVIMAAHAPDTCSPELLLRVKAEARRRGLPVTLHLAQTEQEVQQVERRHGCRSVELLDRIGFLGPDVIAAHCIQVTDAEIALLGRAGITVAHCAAIAAKRGRTARVWDMRDAGANVALGTDNMSEDIVEVLRHALVMGRIVRRSGTDPNPWAILEAATLGGARALGLEREIGSLEPGKQADIVLMDYRQPHLTPSYPDSVVPLLVHCALGSDVHTVLVAGRTIVEAGRVVTVDQAAVIREGQAAADLVWARFEAEHGARVMPGAPTP